MTELDDVFDSLNSMSLLQLLMAFAACTAYTLAQGGLFASRSRGIASVTALVTALAFILLGDTWARSTVLVAAAVAGIGAFVALVWLLGRLFGSARLFDPVSDPLFDPVPDPFPDDLLTAEPDTAATPAPARPAPRGRTVTSST